MGFRRVYGEDWSENGWRMCDSNECVRYNIAGMTIPLRGGVAGTVLSAWIRWYHDNVDRIDEYKPLDDWGWSSTNDVPTSNHLSGTAVDLNATEYPWGGNVMARNYPGRVLAIRKGLALFEGNIFWGGDWSRKDEMHFQLNGGTSSGTGANQKLIDFANAKIKNGIFMPGEPDWDIPVSVFEAFAQLVPGGKL